jgi:quercetin dioxygenase-like cupin family protein
LIKLLSSGVNVAPMLWALHEHPELWDRDPARTSHVDSPHYGLHDIWARFAAPGVDGSQPHEAVWYPCADQLPVRELVYPLMSAVQGDQLGGVLITKIPPGKSVQPHTDPGWHARHYQKFALQIQSHPKQAFHFEGQSLVTKPGDLFWFDNQYTHWVTNDSDQDRITMIVCIRTEWKGG